MLETLSHVHSLILCFVCTHSSQMKERNPYVCLGLAVLLFCFPFSLRALCVFVGIGLGVGT